VCHYSVAYPLVTVLLCSPLFGFKGHCSLVPAWCMPWQYGQGASVSSSCTFMGYPSLSLYYSAHHSVWPVSGRSESPDQTAAVWSPDPHSRGYSRGNECGRQSRI